MQMTKKIVLISKQDVQWSLHNRLLARPTQNTYSYNFLKRKIFKNLFNSTLLIYYYNKKKTPQHPKYK